ncbi:MAG: RNB domain-containing ribonuclease [Methanobacteriota archaeon]
MKPGDVVEFKAGLFGLKPPENLGIYLDRLTKKKTYYVVLYTLKGKQEIRADQLTKRVLASRIQGEIEEEDLAARLKQFIRENDATGRSHVRALKDVELEERKAWLAVPPGTESFSPEELARMAFETTRPDSAMVQKVRDLLARSAREGVGYFERLPTKEERWRPLSREEYHGIARHMEGLHRLRKKLVAKDEIFVEGEAEARIVYRGVPRAEAGLDAADEENLAFLRDVMLDFVLHDRFRGHVGLGGTKTHTIDGFQLFQFAKWLATDWTGARRISVSSSFVELAVDLGLVTVEEAIEHVARRKVLANPDFSWETPERAVRETAPFPDDFPPEWLATRRDLRSIACYTIDPVDAKDFDDAVAVIEMKDGFQLYVHIADVSHYVEKASVLDDHARTRATSVYLPTGVLPMLPRRLSEDLCSLRAGRDRLAMTCVLTYARDGALLREEVTESVIRVTENKHYAQVDAAIGAGEEPFAGMERFARLLGGQRKGLALDTGERKVILEGNEVRNLVKHGTRATKMIEVFMVAANEAVARILTGAGIPVPYRCHPLPDRAGVETLNTQAAVVGLPFRIELPAPGKEETGEEEGVSILDQLKQGRIQLVGGGFILPKEEEGGAEEGQEEGAEAAAPAPVLKGLAQLSEAEQEAYLAPFRNALADLEGIGDERLRGLVYVKMLGAMGRAFYTPRNLGHFGLGSACYCHFTSPIRRYADLLVHRQLRWLLRGAEGVPPHSLQDLEELSNHCTEQSQAAEELERGVVDAAMTFLSRRPEWQGVHDGLVNGLTKGGLFLSLPHGLEARVGSADIGGGPWQVDEHGSIMFLGTMERPDLLERFIDALKVGDRDSEEFKVVRFRLGDHLRVKLAERDYVEGRVAAVIAD